MNYSFKVSRRRGETVGFVLVYLLLLLWSAYFTLPSGQIVIFALLFVPLSGLFLLGLLTTCLFCVTVNGSQLRVRTYGGKYHSFTCADIDRIVCRKTDSIKYGPQFYIVLVKGKQEFKMKAEMDGFETMAEYLLDMSERGELKPAAVSQACKEKLRHYQNSVTATKKAK